MRLATLALLGIAVLTAAGCQQRSVPSTPPTVEIDHAAEGHRAFDAQDWRTAATHYRAALQTTPDDLTLHYRLAIATSWLDLRDEAMQQFEWVVANATTGSEPSRVAQDWLASARKSAASTTTAAAPTSGDERVGDSGLRGRVVWDDGQGPEPQKRFLLQLYTIGDDGRSKGRSFRIRSDREGNYVFSNIPAGTYKLTDNNVAPPRWRLKVELKPGENATIDLGPDNSVKVRDDFGKPS